MNIEYINRKKVVNTPISYKCILYRERLKDNKRNKRFLFKLDFITNF